MQSRAPNNAKRRLLRDFRKLQEEPPQGVAAVPTADNVLVWDAVIFGPKDSIWEDGVFKLKMTFTDDYPHSPPKVKFVTEVFHPNIYKNGDICLDTLQNNWSPAYDVSAILTSIQSLLTDPNPSSPANAEAAKIYQENRAEYSIRVKQCVEHSLQQS